MVKTIGLFLLCCSCSYGLDLQEVLNQAKTTKHDVFIYFSMDGCQPCQKMTNETFVDKSVTKEFAKVYKLNYNIKNKDAQIALKLLKGTFKQRRIENKFPCYFLCLYTPRNYIVCPQFGYKTPKEFVTWFKDKRENQTITRVRISNHRNGYRGRQ